MNTSWKYWEEYLKEQETKFVPSYDPRLIPPLGDFEVFAGCFGGLDAFHRDEAAAGVKQFIAKGKWPNMWEPAQYLCLVRIRFALRFLRLVQLKHGPSCSPVIPETRDATRQQILRWLLVTIWEKEGYAEWQRSFYQIWQELKAMKELDEKMRLKFAKDHKLVQIQTKELPGKIRSDGTRKWDCFLRFENGEAYRATLTASSEPNIPALLEHFRKYRNVFKKV